MTKEGCGRVVFNTHFQVAYAYTMECGYTASTYINEICSIENADDTPVSPTWRMSFL